MHSLCVLAADQATGTAAMHSCAKNGGAGASIGVVSGKTVRNIPEGKNAFELRARGIDGMTYVCFEAVGRAGGGQTACWNACVMLPLSFSVFLHAV